MAKSLTMYMHTLDGSPARVIRFTRGRIHMVVATPGVRVPLHASAGDCRREWNECAEAAERASRLEYPTSPREVHDRAAMDLIRRLDYVLVKIPTNIRRDA